MTALARYSSDQRDVLFGSAAGLAFSALFIAAGYAWLPASTFDLQPAMQAGERIAFALKADVFVFLWVAACIGAVSRGRFYSPSDIAGAAYSAPSPAIAVRAAVLQNSLEQAVLAFGAHLALAAVLHGAELVLVPLLVVLFLVGRVAFAAGYRNGAPGRAFGMAVTAAPTAAGYFLALGLMLAR